MLRPLRTCFVFLPLFFCVQAIANPAAYSLGIRQPGMESFANDMNARGQVAAMLEDENGLQRGYYFEKGKLTELGLPGGRESIARRINADGVVIGSAAGRNGAWQAFLYSGKDGMRVIGTLGGANSNGTAINDLGHAAGFSDLTGEDEWHAFLYRPGEAMLDLGTLGGKVSYANALNNRDQVVGASADKNGYRRAFLYDAAHGMVDLGTLGGRLSAATAINDKGIIAGASETADRHWHAFVYDGKRMTDLGALIGRGNSYATGINNAGHVVGMVQLGDERLSFVWRDGKMLVHGAGKALYLTNAINDSEQVVGATFSSEGLDAAAMFSGTRPFVDQGGVKLAWLCILCVFGAAAAVIWRKRYRGVQLAGYVGQGLRRD
ncbi:MAG TPA: HAF repeat-containing protein [Burkholderiaceae bacterium]